MEAALSETATHKDDDDNDDDDDDDDDDNDLERKEPNLALEKSGIESLGIFSCAFLYANGVGLHLIQVFNRFHWLLKKDIFLLSL